jgi:hypothetical protein
MEVMTMLKILEALKKCLNKLWDYAGELRNKRWSKLARTHST